MWWSQWSGSQGSMLSGEEVSAGWGWGCRWFAGSGDRGGRKSGAGVCGAVAYHVTYWRVRTLSEETFRAGTHLIWLLPTLKRSLLQKRKREGGQEVGSAMRRWSTPQIGGNSGRERDGGQGAVDPGKGQVLHIVGRAGITASWTWDGQRERVMKDESRFLRGYLLTGLRLQEEGRWWFLLWKCCICSPCLRPRPLFCLPILIRSFYRKETCYPG